MSKKQNYCRYCGAAISLIRTSANKTTPCNAESVHYYENAESPDEIITPDGERVKATIIPADALSSIQQVESVPLRGYLGRIDAITILTGFTPHRRSCPNYKNKGATV